MKRFFSILVFAFLVISISLILACQTVEQPKRATDTAPDSFRTENIVVGDLTILGVEHLEKFEIFGNKGWNVYYEFHVPNENFKASKYFVSFGSYDYTNDFARWSGEISRGERLYHLDRYDIDPETHRWTSHSTLGLQKYKERPSYDVIKQQVIPIIVEMEEPAQAPMGTSGN